MENSEYYSDETGYWALVTADTTQQCRDYWQAMEIGKDTDEPFSVEWISLED